MNYNPVILTHEQLQLSEVKDILIAQYELQLATVSLFFAVSLLIGLVLFLRWLLPRYWKLPREAV